MWVVYGVAALGSVTCSAPKGGGTLAPMAGAIPEEAVTRGLPEHAGEWGVERTIPLKPETWQAKPPCRRDEGEVEVRSACWIPTTMRPPCGKLYRHPAPPDSGVTGDVCYRAVRAEPKPPTTLER
jgi:hypothetical protein